MSSVPTTTSPPQGSRARAHARAALAVLAFVLWTVTPFDLRAPDLSDLFVVALDDLFGNLVITVPIGWLLAASIGPHRAVLAMALVSIGVEASQVVLETRHAALSDVLANTAGAFAGAVWWHRPRGPAMANAMLIAIAAWSVAVRHASPTRPAFMVALLLAVGIATVRQGPTDSADAAAFALVGATGFLGLQPVPMALAALGGLAFGVVVADPLYRLRRWVVPVAIVVGAIEAWPPLRLSPRTSDGWRLATELGLLFAVLVAFSVRGARPAPGASCSPEPSSEPAPSRSRSGPP